MCVCMYTKTHTHSRALCLPTSPHPYLSLGLCHLSLGSSQELMVWKSYQVSLLLARSACTGPPEWGWQSTNLILHSSASCHCAPTTDTLRAKLQRLPNSSLIFRGALPTHPQLHVEHVACFYSAKVCLYLASAPFLISAPLRCPSPGKSPLPAQS